MLALAHTTNVDVTSMVIMVAVIAGVVAWHWISRKYPGKWDR